MTIPYDFSSKCASGDEFGRKPGSRLLMAGVVTPPEGRCVLGKIAFGTVFRECFTSKRALLLSRMLGQIQARLGRFRPFHARETMMGAVNGLRLSTTPFCRWSCGPQIVLSQTCFSGLACPLRPALVAS